MNGRPATESRFLRPENDEDFHEPWQYTTGVTSINFDYVIDDSNTVSLGKQELLAKINGVNESSQERHLHI